MADELEAEGATLAPADEALVQADPSANAAAQAGPPDNATLA